MRKLFLRPSISLDFGTANCVIILNESEVVLNEPTVVAVRVSDKKVIGTGIEAKKMLGKEPKGIVAIRPLKNGGISNYKLACNLLSDFMDKSLGKMRVIKPDVKVSVPSRINSIEERALVKALESFGVNRITIVPEALAAAKGAELPINMAAANMIMNLGGGTAEIAIISMGGIVESKSHIGTGDSINEAIIQFLKKEMNLEIGELTAEKIKIKIGNALVEEFPQKLLISAKKSGVGTPVNIELDSNQILPAIRKILNKIVEEVLAMLGDSSSELVLELADRGVALSGGTSQLRNIDKFLTKSLNIPCYVVEDPMKCVVRGLMI